MHAPIFVRELSDPERAQLDAGLRSASAFTVRRAQIVMRKVDGWETLSQPLDPKTLDLAV